MSPRETRVLAAATALTALHVLDDATLHREPGTTVSDYLIGAGALLAVLAVSAAVFPRLRAGAQALLALLLGALAATLGALHLAEVASGVATAWDTASAVVTLGVGLTAAALGIRALWRSRRGGSVARRYLRRTLLAVASLLTAFFVVFPLLFAVGATDKPRRAVEPADLGRPYESVSLRTSDHLELAGWYVPSRNGAAVIAFPGRTGPVPHARMLVRHGYGVLMLDMRGNGESEGRANVFGWGSGKDLEAALDYLSQRRDVQRGAIGGLGLSVGGEQLLEAAAADERLTAVVAEGAGYRTLHEYRQEESVATTITSPQSALLYGAIRLLSPEPYPEPLDRLVPRISPRAIMLIEAGHGQGGETLNPLYFERAGEPKEYWLIPEANHVGGIETRPAEYERRVVGFFDRYLLGADS
ncbi:MAG TPA: CocE/NonD family hydrolase [Gaiellaceae bacterium]|nr:CocE/NonD family hydrolase [Gaiellaceae bacterium]